MSLVIWYNKLIGMDDTHCVVGMGINFIILFCFIGCSQTEEEDKAEDKHPAKQDWVVV